MIKLHGILTEMKTQKKWLLVLMRFFKFLAENKLLSPDGEEIYELGIDSSASLNSSMVTKDGAQFLEQYYDEVLKKNPAKIKKALVDAYKQYQTK